MIRDLYIKYKKSIASIKLYCRGFSDYYQFPFDVSAPMGPSSTDVLRDCCKILEDNKIPYYLCDGTILGIYRDKKLIPHDNDIDVSIIAPIDPTLIIQIFNNSGYSLGRIVKYKGKTQQIIVYSKDNIIFDMCFWYTKENDEYLYNYLPEIKKGRKQHRRYYDEFSLIDFCNDRYTTHAHIEEWLKEHYGEDWNIPKKEKGDWREDAKDIIK